MPPRDAACTRCFTAGWPRHYPSAIALLSDALDLPKPFGPYVLLRRLAVGGMAEVYVAKTKGIGGFEKLVAIKVIHPRFSEDEHFVQMLVEEAKISVQLNHVNIAQTFDLGCIDATYYISMEYVEGADAFRVERRVRDKKVRIPVDICCHIAAEVCNGLSYAHRKRDADGSPLGIVHRDVSPQNVLITYSGEVKLVDFGIAKAALRGGETEVGVIKGKYYYMSPEQAWGDPVDQRTDVFATGLLLHELLTGEMVYQGDNVATLLDKVRKAQIPSPRARRRDVPAELEAVLMKALAKEASDRYESSHAFAQELTRVLYQLNPTFTASRLGQLMATLFPEEVRRHSQILKVPEAPSAEVALDPMSRDEFAGAEDSVIFDLRAVQGMLAEAEPEPDDEEDCTRNDILPFKKSLLAQRANAPPQHATKPLAPPRRRRITREEESTAQLLAGRDEWDEETVLKDEGWQDDSTLVEDGGQAMKALLAFRRQRGAAELSGEKTVAGAPPPIPPIPIEPDAVDELPGERTVAASPHVAPALMDLPPEKTAAWAEGTLPSARKGALAGPSAAGVRLGPEADRFFSPVSDELPFSPDPFVPPDPFAPPPPPVQPLEADPFAAPAHDPFIAQPQQPLDEPLGKPEPKRWIIPAVLGAAALTVLIGAGTWLATRSKPAQFEIISVPEGAHVEIDGRPIAGVTPVTVPDVEPGMHHLRLSHPGYEVREIDLRANEGKTRSVFVLEQIRVTLRVETRPPEAQVWVDNLLRGSAPLDIPGLAVGQTVTLRSSAPGRAELTREVVLTEADLTPEVVLELPPAP